MQLTLPHASKFTFQWESACTVDETVGELVNTSISVWRVLKDGGNEKQCEMCFALQYENTGRVNRGHWGSITVRRSEVQSIQLYICV